jgi:large subunit ribosomal protein L4
MTSVDVRNVRGEVVGSFELDDRVFGIVPNRAVVHQAVVAQLANQRAGTHDTKTRGEVRGGTHKMWRQKGTGRARQGDRRAPHWTGGGVVFGPHPRSYHKDLPRKMRRLAMRSALSARVAEQALTVVDELTVPAPKTKEVRGILQALGLDRGALIVLPEHDEAVTSGARNLCDVRTVTPGSLCLLDVLKYRHLVLTRPAAEALTTQLLAEIRRGGRRGGGASEAAAPQTTVQMDNAIEEARQTGTPQDVAVAEGAEQVATPAAVEEAAEAAEAASRPTRARRPRAAASAEATAADEGGESASSGESAAADQDEEKA